MKCDVYLFLTSSQFFAIARGGPWSATELPDDDLEVSTNFLGPPSPPPTIIGGDLLCKIIVAKVAI